MTFWTIGSKYAKFSLQFFLQDQRVSLQLLPIHNVICRLIETQILEYEKRKESNEQIIKEIKAQRGKPGLEKTYILMGDLFIRQTSTAAEGLLLKDTFSMFYLLILL